MAASTLTLIPGDDWVDKLAAMGDTPGTCKTQSPLTPASGAVCVTGATGFVALELVRQLLVKGYTVKATVRSESDKVKMAPLQAMLEEFGQEKLKIVSGVDLMKADSFDAAIADCVGMFHLASPFSFRTEDPMDVVRPALAGTESCLTACKKAGSIKRVVLTSSTAAITSPGNPADYAYSAKDWNHVSFPDIEGKFPEPVALHGYLYSKTAAEKLAWDIAKAEDCPFDMATIHPPFVIGKNLNKPSTIKDLNESSLAILKVLRGEQEVMPSGRNWSDVADIARAHIAAYEHVEAGGKRFLATGPMLSFLELAEILKELRPSCPVKTAPPAGGVGVCGSYDSAPLKSLSGFTFTPTRETLKAQCDSLDELGFLNTA